MTQKRMNNAVAQLIAASMLLIMALIIVSMIYMYYLSYPAPESKPLVEISGSIEVNNIVLTHKGGKEITLDTRVEFIIGGNKTIGTVGDYLDSESKSDSRWNIGERVVYIPSQNISGLNVEVSVIDIESDYILFAATFQ